jgi:hypothetical protein
MSVFRAALGRRRISYRLTITLADDDVVRSSSGAIEVAPNVASPIFRKLDPVRGPQWK